MTMSTNGGPGQAAPQEAPQLTVVSQYIKDFSFENPNAPQSLTSRQDIRKSEFRSTSARTRCLIATSKFRSNSKAKPKRLALCYSVSIWTLPAFFAFEMFRRKA